ncbi:MAG: peptidylprolyl isomerase [Dehalococcoidales bacterium]|nr:peptidylprolyl isomerase [Dehalococcoidales bacterium]MDX9985969.1 peptidylprolyl isomerase [Dehalococcoidales bacterium]
MSKKKQDKQEWKPTKKHLSNLKKAQRRQKIILFSGISVICLSVVMVVLGLVLQWYIPKIKPLKDVVLEVNGTAFKMNYYIDAVKYQTSGYSSQLVPYFLDPVANNIINGELTRQYANELGYTVSDSEVDEYLEEQDIKPNAAIRDYTHTYLLQKKLIEEHFKTQLPAETELRDAFAIFLESQSQVIEVIARLDSGESFEDIAEELSLDDATKKISGALGKHPAGVIAYKYGSEVLEEAIFTANIGTHSIYDEDKNKAVGYWLIEVLERSEDSESPAANVRVMLLTSEEEAISIRERLVNGEDFDELAEEYSKIWDDESGSLIEEVVPEDISSAFDDYVFGDDLSMNEISQPIRDIEQSTKGGYWLYQVASIETGAISEEDADTLSYLDLEEWLKTIRDNSNNVINNHLDEEKKAFALEKITG